MKCKFCFAQFQDVKSSILPKGHLAEEDAIKIVKAIAEDGFEKITFVGGEPLLCPWLPKLIKEAKSLGLTTMIVTNGSLLTEDFLRSNRNYLDWITISIDSLEEDVNQNIGRGIAGKKPISSKKYQSIIERIHFYRYGLKINTVVNSYNQSEDMNDFIQIEHPKRWKVFQALPVKGQNDACIEELSIHQAAFESFIVQHDKSNQYTNLVSESNDEMQGSYVLIDPAGRFFDNVSGEYRYSQKILEIGIEDAIKQVRTDYRKFKARQGEYDWKMK